MLSRRVLSIASMCFLSLKFTTGVSADDAKFKVATKFKIGGEGRWDYVTVDPASKRLFIPRSDHLIVVSTEDGKVLGEIPNTKGIHVWRSRRRLAAVSPATVGITR